MKKNLIIICAAMLSQAVHASDSTAVLISPTGIYGVTIGMEKSGLDKAWPSLTYEEPIETCTHTELPGKNVSVMLEEGRVIRLDFESPRYQAPVPYDYLRGTPPHVGMPERELISAYSQMTITPHYTDTAGYYLDSAEDENGIAWRYATSQGKVSAISMGTPDAIKRIEGCS